jgi:NADH-quinone oxidoreductase subunit N
MSTETVYLLLPEIILILFATAIYVGGTFTPARDGWGLMSAAGLFLAALALFEQQQTSLVRSAVFDAASSGLWSGPILIDMFSQATRWLVLAVGLLLVMVSSRSARSGLAPEYMGSLLLIVAGLMLVGLAGDLVLMFVGLELVSIPTYVILYLGRGGPASREATTKYFFLSILSSALLLYGFSFLYGVGGSTRLDLIYQELRKASIDAPQLAPLAQVAMVLLFAGLGFRITIVPFHFYAPDVYQGTSHPNAGLLAVVPKIAGLAALVRIVAVAMTGGDHYPKELAGLAWHLALTLSLLTMTLGNLAALWQQNIRRLLAYSSIAHAGYMLIGLAVGFAVTGGSALARDSSTALDGIGSTLFYVLVYALATLGAFAALVYLGDGDRQVETVDDLAGLGRSHPWVAAAMAICMFSLTGLPPLAGFWGKFALLTGALAVDPPWYTAGGGLSRWFEFLALAAVINAAISAGYYLRVVSAMYFRPSLSVPAARGGKGAAVACMACALLVVGVGLNPGRLLETANAASRAARMTVDRRTPQAGEAAANPPVEKTTAASLAAERVDDR